MAVIEERKWRNGTVSYRVKIRMKGVKGISASFERKTDAVRWAKKTETEIAEGRYFKNAQAAKKTVSTLIDRYIELELPKRTNQQQNRATLGWWRNQIGDISLKDLTPAVLVECRDRLLASFTENNKTAKKRSSNQTPKTKSAATVIRYMAVFSHTLSVAVREWEWLDVNPMLRVKRPRLPQTRVRYLSDDERARLLEACKGSTCKYLYPIVVIALSTGARKGEILGLRWKDIDLKRGIARLETTKNRERRALPLTHHAKVLVQALYNEARPEPTDYLFPREDGMAPFTIKKHWYVATAAAGITDFRFHDLRHSAASYLAMNGATLAEIAEVLGHKTLQMVKRYAHLSDSHVSNVVERMNRKIFTNEREEETSDV